MAGNIKGITVEIGGDTTGLSKALGGINKEISSTQKQLKEVEKLLKLDPENTELLAQKQRLLGEAITETRTKLDALKQAEAQAQAQFQKGELSQQEYEKLQRQIVATEQKLQSFQLKAKESTSTLLGVSRATETLSKNTGTLAEKTSKLSKASGLALLSIGSMAVAAGKSADDINTLAKVTGLSTEMIQKFSYASDIIDVDLDTLTKSMAKLTKNMETAKKGTGDAADAFKKLGVSIKDNKGELRSNQAVFNDVINALGKVENETQRDAYAMQIFGKSAQDLNPLILGGADALEELGKEAEDAGLILSQDTLDAANEFNDSIDKLKSKALSTFSKVGSEIAKDLIPVMDDVAKSAEGILRWINKLSPETKSLIAKTLMFSAALSPVAKIASNVTKGISDTTKAISKMIKPAIDATSNTGLLSKAMSTLGSIPGGGLIAAFAGLSVAFGTYLANMDTMTKRTREYIQGVRDMQTANQEAVEAAQATMQERLAEMEMTKDMAARVLELTGAQSLDNQQKAELASLVGMLNDQYPDLNLQLSEQGRLTKDSAKNLEEYIKNLEQSIKTEALRGVAVEQYKALYDAENNLKGLREQQKQITDQLNNTETELYNLTGMTAEQIGLQQGAQGNLNFVNAEARDRVAELLNSWRGLGLSSGDLEKAIVSQKGTVDDLGEKYNGTMSDITNVTSGMASDVTTDLGKVGTESNNMKTEVGKGADGTETEISDMTTNVNKTLESIDGNKVGTNLATGMSDGIKNNSWKVSNETKKMMQGVEDSINANPKFRSLAKSVGLQGFADGGTLTSGLAVVGEEGPEWLSVQSGRATVIPMTTRQKQAVQGRGGGNTVNVGITINNGQFTAADAKRVARMVNRELGMVYR